MHGFASWRSSLLAVVGVAWLLFDALPASAAEERGTFGFAIEVEGEGFFLNPTLKSVTVVSVVAGSRAANAGVAPSDRIIEADGHVVAGAKARDLEPLLKRSVGETLKLKLRRPTGEKYLVALVAAARTAKP